MDEHGWRRRRPEEDSGMVAAVANKTGSRNDRNLNIDYYYIVYYYLHSTIQRGM